MPAVMSTWFDGREQQAMSRELAMSREQLAMSREQGFRD